MLSKLLVLALLALALLPAADAQAATCADYSNQADAQRAADTRDADGDGIYCEALPCPCLKPGESSAPSPKPRPKPKPRRKARVYRGARITSVADGDTIRVRLANGRFEKVRLIGIDTPETKDPDKPVECGGPQATSEMLHLAFTEPHDMDGDGLFDASGGKGRSVVVRTDPTQDTRDRYGRLLAYVTTTSDSDVADADLGAAQLLAGWAKVYVFERNFQRVARYRAASQRAKQNDRGVGPPSKDRCLRCQAERRSAGAARSYNSCVADENREQAKIRAMMGDIDRDLTSSSISRRWAR